MTYSQPDPAEETTASAEPEELDTEQADVESDGAASPSLTVDPSEVPTADVDAEGASDPQNTDATTEDPA
jgi:hypothetical protein